MTQPALNGNPVADFGPGHPFTGAPIVSTYSRANAIADGQLIDVSDHAGPLRFVYPVAVTAAVWGLLVARDIDPEKEPETVTARLDRVLTSLGGAIRRQPPGTTDTVAFACMAPVAPHVDVQVWARCHAGDKGAPCLTVMLEGED